MQQPVGAAGREVARLRHRVDVPGNDDPLGATELGPRHDRVTVPIDLQVRVRAERLLDGVGDLSLGPAHREEVNERGGQVGAVLAKVEKSHGATVMP